MLRAMNIESATARDPAYRAALAYLETLVAAGIKLGLDRTRTLLAAVGNPHEGLRFVHVTGTNGKGSVCALLASACQACGRRTALYTSPHLVSLRERFRVNGVPISEAEFAALTAEVRERTATALAPGDLPTFFEFTTAVGFLWFQRQRCDVGIIEVGMGGRLDSTNVITPLLSIITSIGLEHTAELGPTVAAIAGEKAGIIKPGVPVITAVQVPEARAVVMRVATERQAPVLEAGRDFAGLARRSNARTWQQTNTIRWGDQRHQVTTSLLGEHQLGNTSLAWAAVCQLREALGLDLRRAAAGMRRTRWPARFERLPDGLLLDGAHNPHGMAMAVGLLRELAPDRRWHVMFGALQTKDWRQVLRELVPVCASLTVAPVANPKAEDPERIAAFVREAWPELPVATCADVGAGLATLRERGHGLVIGSLYLAGEVLSSYTGGEPVNVESKL